MAAVPVRGLLLINDLSAVITASDPSERRTKLFGNDCGRKRCKVVGFCNSAGAAQKRRYKACIKIRQARPESAREILRQRVIGMLLIFGSTAYLVHVTNRVPWCPLGREVRHYLRMFFGDIEPVERVEQNEAVALSNKERFPVLPCRLRRDGRHRFGDDYLGSKALPIAAEQNIAFGALDVDFKEVDRAQIVPFA
jgi:hypothetical protein